MLVRSGRVHARLRADRIRVGVGIGAGDPLGDALDHRWIGLAGLVGTDRHSTVVHAGFQAVQRVVQ